MAAVRQKEMSATEVAWLARIGMAGLAIGVVLLPVGVWLRMTGDVETGVRLIAASSLGMILGFPFVGAIPPYLAGREFGFPFAHFVRSPFRWGRGARAVRAFGHIRSIKGVTWIGFAVLVQFGADAEVLAEAIEIRHAMGYPVDLQVLLAAHLVGLDLIQAAKAEDIYAFIVETEAERSSTR